MAAWIPSELPQSSRLYLSIVEALQRDVNAGKLRPGDRLSTHRELAFKLGVSISTVSRAYVEAIGRGLIVSEVGRGTFVLPSKHPDGSREVLDHANPGYLDLGYNCPIPNTHVLSALSAGLIEVANRTDLARLVAYERPYLGLAEHREAAAAWLDQLGFRASPDQVAVVAGAQHGMATVLSSISKPGDTLLTEELTDPGLIFLAKMHNLKLRGVTIDEEGLVPDALEAACRDRKAVAVVCMPNHQSPTLSVMSPRRREEIAAIARRQDILIVESDTYGAFVESHHPSLSTYAPEQSFYITSLSKILAPGLRIGFVATPRGRVLDLVPGLGATSWMASPITAEIAASWVRNGTASRLAAMHRRELAARHNVFREIFERADFKALSSSLHVWLRLPHDWRVDAFVRQAQANGVTVASSEVFAVGHNPAPQAVRISLGGGAATRQDLRHGLSVVAKILGERAEPSLPIL
jgi:DNA-binding transcriptional MocR family regulator